MRLENKVAIITGAGRGMGHAEAVRFAKEGAQVVVAEIDETSAKQTFEEIGRRGLLSMTDMASVADINALVDKTMATFGRVDILINNAGVTRSLGFFDVTEADWDWMYSINARGLFFCMQRVAREMMQQRSGKIINIASIAGIRWLGVPYISYAATKAAVIQFTRVIALQYARSGIRATRGTSRTRLCSLRR